MPTAGLDSTLDVLQSKTRHACAVARGRVAAFQVTGEPWRLVIADQSRGDIDRESQNRGVEEERQDAVCDKHFANRALRG